MIDAHLDTALRLQQNITMRGVAIAKDAAQVCSRPPKVSTIVQAADLAEASFKQVVGLQASWANGWAEWWAFSHSIKDVDTLPKYVTRISNIGLQAEAQLARQVEEATELSENLAISYAHWLAQLARS